jgi:hypothetical protein
MFVELAPHSPEKTAHLLRKPLVIPGSQSDRETASQMVESAQPSNMRRVKTGRALSTRVGRVRQFVCEDGSGCARISLEFRHGGMPRLPTSHRRHDRPRTGLNFDEDVARLRVEKAKNLLQSPKFRISEAEFEVGFQSLSQFNRAFHRIAGMSPRAYRTSLGSVL